MFHFSINSLMFIEMYTRETLDWLWVMVWLPSLLNSPVKFSRNFHTPVAWMKPRNALIPIHWNSHITLLAYCFAVCLFVCFFSWGGGGGEYSIYSSIPNTMNIRQFIWRVEISKEIYWLSITEFLTKGKVHIKPWIAPVECRQCCCAVPNYLPWGIQLSKRITSRE